MKQNDNYNLRIARTVKALRKLRSLTQQEIASALFIERSAYCKLENGDVKITIETLKAISEVFKTSLFQIIVIAEADMLINFRLTSLSEILIRYTSYFNGGASDEPLSKEELEFIITKMKLYHSKDDSSIKNDLLI